MKYKISLKISFASNNQQCQGYVMKNQQEFFKKLDTTFSNLNPTIYVEAKRSFVLAHLKTR